MKTIFKSTWFQIIFFGLLIGLALILIDSNTNSFNVKKEEGLYKGPIQIEKDKTYFTKALYSGYEYDFGKVKEGDTVIHVFKLKNMGKEPLMIYKAKGSCECINAFPSSESIMPDSTAVITVYFKTKGRNGAQTRTVSVITNTDPSEAILTFKGVVE